MYLDKFRLNLNEILKQNTYIFYKDNKYKYKYKIV